MNILDKIFSIYNDKLIFWYLALGYAYSLSNCGKKNIIINRHVLLNYFWKGKEEIEAIFKT